MEDRNKVYTDEKNRIIDFSQFSYTAPESGIYEGDLRYFAVNSDWYPIVIGWIDHLAQIYAWGDAEDERHHGIQQILIFEQGVDMPVIDCGDIEDCIENSPTIIDIINGGGLGYNPESPTTPISEGSQHPIAEEPIIVPEDCGDDDKDKLWGAISSFVDFCHDTNLDLFQKISQAASIPDLMAIAIEAIPLIGAFPADEGLEVVNWFLNNLGVGYQAEVTTIALYELKCELFCESVANDCEFTIEIAMNFFLTNAGIPSISLNSNFVEIATALVDLTALSGIEWFSAISFLQLSVASLGETFVNQKGLNFYLKSAQAGALSGDSGWTVWCDECNEPPDGTWLLVLDFANDYVKNPGEFVIRDAFTLLKDVSKTGSPQLTQQYQVGVNFTRDENGEQIRKKIVFANSPELANIAYWGITKDSGTTARLNYDSVVEQGAVSLPLSTTAFSSTFSLAATPGTFEPITQIEFHWTMLLNSQLGGSKLKYLRITGQGALPVFA